MVEFEYRDGALAAIKPPLGVTPNFENPESRAREVVAVLIGMLTLTTLIVSLRVYTRLYVSRAFGIDDSKVSDASDFCALLTSAQCAAWLPGYV